MVPIKKKLTYDAQVLECSGMAIFRSMPKSKCTFLLFSKICNLKRLLEQLKKLDEEDDH